MTKKSIIIITLFLILVLCGCNTENQKLKKVEVYSSNKTLLNTIENKDSLATFNDNISLTENWTDIDDDDYWNQQDELKGKLENNEAQYVFIMYQTSAAMNKSETLEKVMELTAYENSNIIKVEVSPDTVKNVSIPSEYLTYYFETSDDTIEYLNSLVKQ